MASFTDILSTIQNGVVALNNLTIQMKGSFTNISGQLSTKLTVISSARTYFVRSDGSDNNTGLANTSTGAFLTVQKAIDVCHSFDIGGQSVTIQISSGTYPAVVLSTPFVGGLPFVLGDTVTPSNVTISSSVNHAITVLGSGVSLVVSGLKVASGFGHGLSVSLGGDLQISAIIEFGACTNAHISAITQGRVRNIFNSTIISGSPGAAWSHVNVQDEALVDYHNSTVTLTSSINTTTFVNVVRSAELQASGMTFVGSSLAVCSRYNVASGGLIETSGGSSTYFPGNAGGTGTNYGVAPYGLYE